MSKQAIALAKRVDSKIFILRGQKVILDADLAALYGVPVKRLNQQVNRNADRFPRDFIFRLSVTEYENLRLQFATSSFGHGGRRSLPYAFTEHERDHGRHNIEFRARHPNEHFRGPRFRSHARGAGGKSAGRRQAE